MQWLFKQIGTAHVRVTLCHPPCAYGHAYFCLVSLGLSVAFCCTLSLCIIITGQVAPQQIWPVNTIGAHVKTIGASSNSPSCFMRWKPELIASVMGHKA